MKRSLPFFVITIIFCGCLWAQEEVSALRIALRQLVDRADAGDAKALFDLARLHDTGYDSISIDTLRSTGLYLRSAKKGYAPAMNFIGFRYYNGEGVSQNLDSALYWIQKAANQGDVTAAANLGYLLTESTDVDHNEEEALKWLTIASEAGVPEAQIKLIELQEDHWKELPLDSISSMSLGYYLGRAPIAGVKLLEIASEKGDAHALALLGDAYSKGVGVAYDHQKSIDYFYKAAISGDPSAQFIIAELLEIFPDAIPDSEGAEYWKEKAYEAGVTNSDEAYEKLYATP